MGCVQWGSHNGAYDDLTTCNVLQGPALALPGAQLLAQAAPALDGYDPVAYFTEGAPRRGDAAHALDWEGKRWHFVSAANRAAFAADPTAYAPQYGANCAWAAAEGLSGPGGPERLGDCRWQAVSERRSPHSAPVGARHSRLHRAGRCQLAALAQQLGRQARRCVGRWQGAKPPLPLPRFWAEMAGRFEPARSHARHARHRDTRAAQGLWAAGGAERRQPDRAERRCHFVDRVVGVGQIHAFALLQPAGGQPAGRYLFEG